MSDNVYQSNIIDYNHQVGQNNIDGQNDIDNMKDIVTILFLGSTLFLISSFCATSLLPGSLSYTYHHYLLILGPLTFTIRAL